MKNNYNFNKWEDFSYKLNSQLISDITIKDSLLQFYKIISSLNEDLLNNSNISFKLAIIFKIKTINNQYRSISHLQIINIEDFDKLIQLFIECWNIKAEEYYLAPHSHIIFTYNLLTDINITTKIDDSNILKNKDKTNKIETFRFAGYNLPNTMDFTTWGDYHFLDERNVIVHKKSSKLEYHIELFNNYQKVELKSDDFILLSFKDTMNDKSDLSTFTRTIKRQEYIFEEGKLLLKKIEKNVKFLSSKKKDKYLSDKIITMDLETRTINERMSAYCVSIYDGKIFKSFYLDDFSNDKEMLRNAIKYLMKRKYDNYKVYLHNFSKFDAIFLLSIMSDVSKELYPIIRDGRIIDLKFNFSDKYTLYFRDSFLLLPDSLRRLAKNFNVENKGIFPYKFVNDNNISLDYNGEVPDINYFDNISNEEYISYTSNLFNNWNLRKETIKYCELDCIVLYQILIKFSRFIYQLFRIDIFKYPTLSSLAFAIYRSNFLKSKKIPLIHGEMFNFIKQAYTGGSVDIYKPSLYNNHNKKIFRYDVNSLYPFAMKNYPMPCDYPIYFEGNILLNNDLSNEYKNNGKPYGIFEVDIIAPNIKIPLLQTKLKINNGYRTISPTGNWTGYYFSDELYNAEKYGYKFKIKRGYLFKSCDLFSEYVDFLYNLKKNSKKGSPNYLISKLLMNSLYGRFGMNPDIEHHMIITNELSSNYYNNKVTNIIDLKNGKQLISFHKNYEESDYSVYEIKNISVVVSTIISSSSRIFMSQFKTNENIIIYYSDTDSIDVEKELDPIFVGNELGQMKLEHIFDDVVFLSPKMYGGINKDYEYVKVKGLKNTIEFKELKKLLFKNSKIEVKQEKWYSDISEGIFHVKDEIYTLMVTENKRKLLYDENNLFYDTIPIHLIDGKIVN